MAISQPIQAVYMKYMCVCIWLHNMQKKASEPRFVFMCPNCLLVFLL